MSVTDAAAPETMREEAGALRAALARVAAALEAERERWFTWVPVLVGLGIVAYFALPAEPWTSVAVALLCAAAALPWAGPARGTGSTVLYGILVASALGFALAKLRAETVAAPVLERRIGPVEVRGYVELVEPRATRGERLTLRVTALDRLPPAEQPYRVRVRTLQVLPGLKPGHAVRLRAHLAPPAPPALPGAYDFARAAWFQGIGALGFALARPEIDAEAVPPPLGLRIGTVIEGLRQAIGARVRAGLPGETGAIATALITGERGGISEETNAAFRDSGLLHVLSISGLHMAVIAGAVFACVRLGLALVPTVALRHPIKKWAAVAAAVAALGYLMISGAAFATVRSYIMISIMFLAVLLDRPAIGLRNVALAALVILVLWPESLHDVGFQMSFAAVTALVAAYELVRERARQRQREGGRGGAVKLLLFLGGIVLSTDSAEYWMPAFAGMTPNVWCRPCKPNFITLLALRIQV
jgi:competence protein ComEC